MSPIRRIILLISGLASLLVPARAAVLIHNYTLAGTLNDSIGGPALTSLGGQITALGYVFAANQGLLFSSPSFNPASYSLEFRFKFDSTVGYDKIVDFHQLSTTDDSGLYERNGHLNFYPAVQPLPGAPEIMPGAVVSVFLTRDSETNLVTGFLNGQVRFAFVDTGLLAVSPIANGNLNFFVDDRFTGQLEAAGGTVNSIRVYNGALSTAEVLAVFNSTPLAIPEPSTMALLLVGASLVLFTGSRRRKKL